MTKYHKCCFVPLPSKAWAFCGADETETDDTRIIEQGLIEEDSK